MYYKTLWYPLLIHLLLRFNNRIDNKWSNPTLTNFLNKSYLRAEEYRKEKEADALGITVGVEEDALDWGAVDIVVLNVSRTVSFSTANMSEIETVCWIVCLFMVLDPQITTSALRLSCALQTTHSTSNRSQASAHRVIVASSGAPELVAKTA